MDAFILVLVKGGPIKKIQKMEDSIHSSPDISTRFALVAKTFA